MTPCDLGMAALRDHRPLVHMRPTGGLAQTTLMTSSTTGGSVKGKFCADADVSLPQPSVRLVTSRHGDGPGQGSFLRKLA